MTIRSGVSILCMCACGGQANNEFTYNKLRTEQSTDFKLYIGSDEPFVVFAQHVLYVKVPMYLQSKILLRAYRTTIPLATVSHVYRKHN